jgi:hypothetical protein
MHNMISNTNQVSSFHKKNKEATKNHDLTIQPGSLTKISGRVPTALFGLVPSSYDFNERDCPIDIVGKDDGLLFVVGSYDVWRFILTQSSKLGWVHVFDLHSNTIL